MVQVFKMGMHNSAEGKSTERAWKASERSGGARDERPWPRGQEGRRRGD